MLLGSNAMILNLQKIKIHFLSPCHCNYIHTRLTGWLLGEGKVIGKAALQSSQEEPGSPRATQEKVSVEISDALPLFHTSLSLAPMTETALIQVPNIAMPPLCLRVHPSGASN